MLGLRLILAASLSSLLFFVAPAPCQSPPELTLGNPIAGEISVEEIHDYLLKVVGPRLIHVIAVQKGIDVRLRLMGPDGKQLTETNWYDDTEDLWYKLEAGGNYTLKVRGNGVKGGKGGYEIRIAEMVDPVTGDTTKLKAIESTADGIPLAAIGKSGANPTRPAAVPKFKDAITAYLALNDLDNATKLVTRLHLVLWALSRHQEQIEYFNELLKTEAGSKISAFRGQLLTRNAFAYYAIENGKPEPADELYGQALEVWKRLRNDEMVFTTLTYRGENWRSRKNPSAAIPFLEEAARYAETVPKPHLLRLQDLHRVLGILYHGEARTAHNRGGLYASRGIFEKAAENYRKAIEVATSDPIRMLMYVNLSAVYGDLNDYPRAYEASNNAFKIIEGGKVTKRDLKILWANRGRWAMNQGDLNGALDAYQRALSAHSIEGATPDELQKQPELLPSLQRSIASLYASKGDYAQAMQFLRLALDGTRDTDLWMPGLLSAVGNVHANQGNLETARDYHRRSIAINEKLGGKDAHFPATKLLAIGATYVTDAEYVEALKYLNEALEIFRKLDDKLQIANALDLIGAAYGKQGKYHEALTHLNEGLELRKQLPSKLDLVTTQHNIASIHLVKGDFQTAVELSDRASEVFEKEGALDRHYHSQSTTGLAHVGMKQPLKARKAFETAIELLENLRGRIAGGEVAQAEFKLSTRPYFELAAILADEGKTSEALLLIQRAKSRALLDILQNGRVDVTKALTVEEKQKERQLKNELFSLNRMLADAKALADPHPEYLKELTTKIDRKRREFDDFQFGIYAAHPELKIQRGDLKPITLEGTSALLPNLRSALVEFLVGEHKTLLLVVTRGPSDRPVANLFTINTKEKLLEEKIEAFRSKLAAGDLDFAASSRELYDILLKPADRVLGGATDIVIAPDGVLWAVPFQALQDGRKKFLAETTSISLTPSLTSLAEMKKAKKGATQNELLAFGNPIVGKETSERVQRVFMSEKLEPIPEAERLVTELARMYGPQRSRSLVGGEAREDTAKAEASKYRIVQFATHGILNNASPMYSHLVLARGENNSAEDGLLEAWELKDLDLKADMVILSACDTARGKISGGEGVIGMTWAAFIAGAPTTVASLWKVESSSTTEFMLEFHRQMLAKKKISKAEALRRASLKLMRSSKYRHPLYWAPWVMVGDGS